MITATVKHNDNYADIEFPCSEAYLSAKLMEIHVDDLSSITHYISAITEPKELSFLKDRLVNLDELNYLAKRMDSFFGDEETQFFEAIKLEHFTEMKDLINLTFNLDKYTLIKDVSDMGKVGRKYLLNTEGCIPADDEDNPYAEYLLGKTLFKGEDTKQDLIRAESLLRRSSEQHNKYASYTLGKALLDGNMLIQDIPEAIRLLTESADSGFPLAEYLLGKLLYHGEVVERDISKALLYLERAAEKENACAACLAGKIRLTEDRYMDIQKAIRLFQIAAAQENHYAEYQLGLIYLKGKDIQRDEQQAIRWLTASAEHGNQYAAQLLHSIKNNRNWFAAMSTLRLLHHMSQMIRNRLEDECKGKNGAIIDRKLRRKIQEKNEALGIKQG